MISTRWAFYALAWASVTPLAALAQTPTAGATPDSSAVEACAGGRISSIDVDSRSIYDPSSTSIAPLAWTYGLLNLLHVNTTETFIRGELLFEEGDCFDPFLLQESYRLLDQHGFLYVEEMAEEPDDNGGRRVRVATRDEWSTKVDIGPTYDDGLNLERLQVTEENFLGSGVFGEYTYYARRETRTQSFGVRTPRFFGRSDAGIALGSTRSGRFFDQYWRYPFVGEAGRVAVRQGYENSTDFFAYSTDGAEPFVQVLVPLRRELAELSGAYRFGRPGASIILGGSLTREKVSFPETTEVTFGDFDDRDTFPGAVPAEMQRQLREHGSMRASLHLGTRRYRYLEVIGLDAMREPNLLGFGVFAGVTVGHGVGFLQPNGVPEEDDLYTRTHVSTTQLIGSSVVHASGTVEARRGGGEWRDVLADADLSLHLRSSDEPTNTVFFRASVGGGWDTALPFQVSLGGRQGVRSLEEDRYPGGRVVRFILEDRIVFPWPTDTADLGFTLFGDLGRVWPGDVPYGVDSGWQAALGFGLRIGLPHRARYAWRTDLAFPVGSDGGKPIFRVSFELNALRSTFFTPDVLRSRRFTVGPETF
ncbi:MAG: hypothetical protein WEB90_07925 [Gemmatimonadota bacterium]